MIFLMLAQVGPVYTHMHTDDAHTTRSVHNTTNDAHSRMREKNGCPKQALPFQVPTRKAVPCVKSQSLVKEGTNGSGRLLSKLLIQPGRKYNTEQLQK